MMILWRVEGKIIGSVLCSIVCNSCAQCNAHTYEQTLTVVCWLVLAFFCGYIVCYSLSVLDLAFLGIILYYSLCAFVELDLVISVLCQEIG